MKPHRRSTWTIWGQGQTIFPLVQCTYTAFKNIDTAPGRRTINCPQTKQFFHLGNRTSVFLAVRDSVSTNPIECDYWRQHHCSPMPKDKYCWFSRILTQNFQAFDIFLGSKIHEPNQDIVNNGQQPLNYAPTIEKSEKMF